MGASSQPNLVQFRIEPARDGLIHLVFDMPDRSMNVFSNAAIREIGDFATWLKTSDVRGVVVRSGKTSAFCAGADLGELGVAYDMIMAAPEHERFDIAFAHFFPLSLGFRALETSGKPVAAVISGLALGGGCELALATHYRVMADTPKAALGLPESLVGLLPGAGGTQRLPRLIGVDAALPILLDGARLSGNAALAAGLVDALVPPGEEVATAEAWLLSDDVSAVQPWDRTEAGGVANLDAVSHARSAVLEATLGHQPAPLAILDCIVYGLPLPFDHAIREEMRIFSNLIQRREPRNMIQTLFSGKLDHDRALRAGSLSPPLASAVETLSAAVKEATVNAPEGLSAAGFAHTGPRPPAVRGVASSGFWLDEIDDPRCVAARLALRPVVEHARRLATTLDADERRLADYAVVSRTGFPAYLGGPFAFAETRMD